MTFSRALPIVRGLWRDRAVTIVAVGTLALGIGVSTALFTVVNATLLRPLPYPSADRLVVLRVRSERFSSSYPSLPANAMHVAAWGRECGVCEGVAAVGSFSTTLTGSGEPEQLDGYAVSAGFFDLLGVPPLLGRGFLPEEDRAGAPEVVMIGEGLWRRRFAGDPAIVGRPISLNGRPVLVVGIVAARTPLPGPGQLGDLVRLPPQPDLFRPVAFPQALLGSHGDFDFGAIARLHPGVTIEQAVSVLDRIEASIAGVTGDRLTPLVEPLQALIVRQSRGPLWILMGATVGVLLIVCVNLANLLLARQAGRSRDAAIRLALGAGRGRLTAESLLESLVLACAGGAGGLLLARVLTRAIGATAPAALPRLNVLEPDARVLLFVSVTTMVTGVLIGLLPALRLGQTEPGGVLKAGSYTTTEEGRTGRARRVLVASQAALGALLLVATGLLLASFVRLLNVNKGFETSGILTVDVALPPSTYPQPAQQWRYVDASIEALRSVPGVTAVAATNRLPLRGEAVVNALSIEGDQREAAERPLANYRFVTPDYFSAIGTPLLRGRTFQDSDRGRPVVILSASAARVLWPGVDPIGRHVRTHGSLGALSEIIGVAADSRAIALQRDDVHFAYLPYWLRGPSSASFIVRATSDPVSIAGTVRERLRQVDRGVPIVRLDTMRDIVDRSLADRRFALALMLQFGAAAAVLAALGAYGIVSYAVARRRREMSIRVALGATPAHVRRLVFGEGLVPVLSGLAVGLVGSLWLGRLMGSMLFDVMPGDPLVLGPASAVLLLAAAAACAGPARRATQTNVVANLR